MKTEKREAKVGERVVAVRDCVFSDFAKGDTGKVVEIADSGGVIEIVFDGGWLNEVKHMGLGAIMVLADYEVIVEDGD